MEKDRISCLPDCLLIEIISRIKIQHKYPNYPDRIMTTKEVVRTTATISKRWQRLWTLLPNLIFDDEEDLVPRLPHDLTHYASFIDRTLVQSPPSFDGLNELTLCVVSKSFNRLFRSQAISWIRHAVLRNANKVYFRLCVDVADALFFDCESFTDMTLCACSLRPPNGVIRWVNLESLRLHRVKLGEDVIENILSGTPRLKRLVFQECYGYRAIRVNSKSLTMFTFKTHDGFEEFSDAVDYVEAIEINAPNLSALTIECVVCLNKLLLLDVSSVIKAELIYRNDSVDPGTPWNVLEEEMLKGLIQSLRHANDISFGDHRSEVLSRLNSKDFHFQFPVPRSDT